MKIHHSKKSKKISKVWLISAVVVVALLGGSYFAYGYYTKSLWPFAEVDTQSTEAETQDVNEIDYSPPTQEEVEQSQNGKKNSARQETETQSPHPSNAKQEVAVGVSFAGVVDGKVEVRAFTPGIIEGGGTCTAVFTKNGKTITATSSAFVDSSSSLCNPIYVDVAQFPETGSWNLTVSYESSNAAGSSEGIEVTL